MTAVVVDNPVIRFLEIGGLALTAGIIAALSAMVYRWYLRERVATGLALLVALSVVALYLNVKSALGDVVAGETAALSVEAVLFNGAALVVAAATVPLGVRAGDRVYRSTAAVTGDHTVDGEVSRFIRTVGRLVAIELPADVEDIPGYDPVADDVKTSIADTTLLFPRGLSLSELEDRIELRLTDDYDIGAVDFDLDPDGTITYLAVGRHPAGLGPTLGPGTAAVAVTADPPYAASPGDSVQLWTPPPNPERVTTAEVRATHDDTVTLALDSHDAPIVAGGDYRLLTLPQTPRPDREFSSLLRAADATMAAVTIASDSPLTNATVAAIHPTIIAISPADGAVDLVPGRTRRLTPGDTLYVVARPDVIRRIETAATPSTPTGAEPS